MMRAQFIVPPELFLRHRSDRFFIGPGSVELDDGSILMASPWGRPPANFEQLAATHPMPPLYRSNDGGRTFVDCGRLNIEWALNGMISDGGLSFHQLSGDRLILVAHRHVEGRHGGGMPAITFSSDRGHTWEPARQCLDDDGVWYVMNDRLVETAGGRLVLPVSHMPRELGTYEGDVNISCCLLSDDGGRSWRRSRTCLRLPDARGMAEPSVAVAGDSIVLLARTGSGYLFSSRSHDGGDTWSQPQATTLRSPCSSLTLKSLPDGRLIAFYNHATPFSPGSFFPRTPLCYAVSEDAGHSWGDATIVDDIGASSRDRQAIYPSVCCTGEGIVLIYSVHPADPGGSFTAPPADQFLDCGAVRAILAYPA